MQVFNFGQPDQGVIQTAFITDDIQRSMQQMTALLNIGPWFLFENFELMDLKYRGASADFEITLALANSGHMQFELIQPLDGKSSPYREVQQQRGWGFHHYGVAAVNFDEVCQDYSSEGFEQVLSGAVPIGARAAYFDTRDSIYGMVEVIEMTSAVEELWNMIRNASVGWKGGEPVRILE